MKHTPLRLSTIPLRRRTFLSPRLLAWIRPHSVSYVTDMASTVWPNVRPVVGIGRLGGGGNFLVEGVDRVTDSTNTMFQGPHHGQGHVGRSRDFIPFFLRTLPRFLAVSFPLSTIPFLHHYTPFPAHASSRQLLVSFSLDFVFLMFCCSNLRDRLTRLP